MRKKISKIETMIDGLDAGKKPFRRTKRLVIKPLTFLIVIGVLVGVAAGGVITFYLQVSGSHSVGRVWEIRHNASGSWTDFMKMEEYQIDFTTSDNIGGDTESFDFEINLSGYSAASKSLKFIIDEPLDDGVNVSVFQGETEIVNNSNWLFYPGVSQLFTYQVTFDPYIKEGSYETSLKLVKP